MVNDILSNKNITKELKQRLLTIYGRNPVMEALEDNSLHIFRLHLSKSNKHSAQLEKMKKLANKRGIEILYHDKDKLSRISKNAKQDQGVALDIEMINLPTLNEFIKANKQYRIIALDNLTNPQNIGMIIRSCAAGNIDAVLLPLKKNSTISPLVIKASAGTLFRIPVIRTSSLKESLMTLKKYGGTVIGLDADGDISVCEMDKISKSIFVLGSESEGLSPEIAKLCDKSISIPMKRGVESLNVAVTASLIALCPKCGE